MSTKIIAIANNKGGVGKTTATINIGQHLALLGNKVLLIDFDPQGNLSQSFPTQEESDEDLVFNKLINMKPLSTFKVEENLYLAPTDIRMGKLELELSSKAGADRRLQRCIKLLLEKQPFDYILIDCPPSLGFFTLNALTAANEVLITIQPEISAFYGIDNLIDLVSEVQNISNEDLKIKGLFFNLVANKTIHKTIITQIQERYSKYMAIYKTEIGDSKYPKEAQLMEQTLNQYAPNTKINSQYASLVKEII